MLLSILEEVRVCSLTAPAVSADPRFAGAGRNRPRAEWLCTCCLSGYRSSEKLGRLHVIPPLCSKVEMEFSAAQDSARDLAEHFGVWLKRGVKKNLLCVFHMVAEP